VSKLKYKKGDVVRIDPVRCRDWAAHETGVIWSDQPHTTNPSYSGGYGGDNEKPPGGWPPIWRIRLDGYDYGENPTNCHFISEQGILLVTEEDVEEAIASILKGAT
jgi:hypothetical protein